MKVLPSLSATVFRASALKYFGSAFGAKGSRLGVGRFDRTGTVALYVSLELETAYAEFQQGRPDVRPCAIMSAYIEVKNLLDLRGSLRRCSRDIRNWNCDWEAAEAVRLIDPFDPDADCASWRCGDLVLRKKLAGIIFPSTKKAGGSNLAIFTEDVTSGHYKLEIHDPLDEIGPARLAPS